jgi:hypothetical protein
MLNIYTTRPNHFRSKAQARKWLHALIARTLRWTALIILVLAGMINF